MKLALLKRSPYTAHLRGVIILFLTLPIIIQQKYSDRMLCGNAADDVHDGGAAPKIHMNESFVSMKKINLNLLLFIEP